MAIGTLTTTAKPFRNTRRWPRYKLDVPIRVIATSGEKDRVVSGRGRDISEGGVQVFAGNELRVGDRIQGEFTPPYGEPLRVAGHVRNRNGYYYGVEFLRGTPREISDALRLRDILQSLSSVSPSS